MYISILHKEKRYFVCIYVFTLVGSILSLAIS